MLDIKTVNGYILIKFPIHPHADKCGYVQEHRIMVEIFIGRLLKPEEVVHHINFSKLNNDISNLMLFPNQTEHAKFHAKIRQFGMTNPVKRQISNRWKEFF